MYSKDMYSYITVSFVHSFPKNHNHQILDITPYYTPYSSKHGNHILASHNILFHLQMEYFEESKENPDSICRDAQITDINKIYIYLYHSYII